MPLLLTQSDLRPLAGDDEALEGAIDAVEERLLRSHDGEPCEAIFAGLTLANGDELATLYTAAPSGPASIRIFPHTSTGFRSNAWLGLQIDGTTGEVGALIALDDLNVLRTSIPAAVGVRHLAPDGAATLAVLGSGTQARSHVRTFARVMPNLEIIRVWSPTQEHRERFAAEMSEQTGLPITALGSAQEAVADADVITAAGRYAPGQPALEDPSWVRPGALLVSLTFSGANLLQRGARLVLPTAQRPELIAAGFSSGFLRDGPPPAPPAAELAEVIGGRTSARSNPEDTLVFELAAPYPWDLPIFDWIVEWAKTSGRGTEIKLSD